MVRSSAAARSRALFAFYLDYGLASIAWLDGPDFAPEFLYDKLTPMHYDRHAAFRPVRGGGRRRNAQRT